MSLSKYTGLFHISIFFITCCANHLYAQSKYERIDSLMTTLYENNQFSGSILIEDNVEIIYHKAFGWNEN